MIRKLCSLILCLVLALSFVSCGESAPVADSEKLNASGISADFEKTADEVCSEIVAGWNLGNTLEACQIWGEISDTPTPQEQETGWNNPLTTQGMIDFVADSGFNAIRVPVTWELQIEENDGTYTVKEEWMARVKEIADYCVNAGVYVIVNMHHDDGAWLNISASDDQWEEIKEKYRQIWVQIADTFKDYNAQLILEGANEITATTAFDGCGESDTDKCWWGHNQMAFDRINELYKIFVDTVRDSGGNNDKRYLMLPTYGAQWYDNQINKLWVPENDNHIIMDVHWYQPDTSDKEANRWVFRQMRTFADEHEIGAVLGESGMMAEYPDEKKTAFAENVVGCAGEYDIPVFLWDDGGDLRILERSELTWNSDAYVNEVVKVAKETEVVY